MSVLFPSISPYSADEDIPYGSAPDEHRSQADPQAAAADPACPYIPENYLPLKYVYSPFGRHTPPTEALSAIGIKPFGRSAYLPADTPTENAESYSKNPMFLHPADALLKIEKPRQRLLCHLNTFLHPVLFTVLIRSGACFIPGDLLTQPVF